MSETPIDYRHIDYNRLPADPEELYALLNPPPVDVFLHGTTDVACLAPTWGSQKGCSVWVALVPGERRAYKILLNYSELMDQQRLLGILLSRPDLVAQPEAPDASPK